MERGWIVQTATTICSRDVPQQSIGLDLQIGSCSIAAATQRNATEIIYAKVVFLNIFSAQVFTLSIFFAFHFKDRNLQCLNNCSNQRFKFEMNAVLISQDIITDKEKK